MKFTASLGVLIAVLVVSPCVARTQHSQHSESGDGGSDADTSMFYKPLKADGTWYNTTQFGDVWHPKIADQDARWRPYQNGSWVETQDGWTWASNEPFGWAVYHYGRWTHLEDIGWAWVPGQEWAGSWVSWRESSALDSTASGKDGAPSPATATVSAPAPLQYTTTADTAAPHSPSTTDTTDSAPSASDTTAASAAPAAASNDESSGGGVQINYIGWAPLPPDATLSDDQGIGPAIGADDGIAPEDYCFANAVDLGLPDLAVVILPPERNYVFIGRTVDVTNIVYLSDREHIVYAGGPSFARLNALSSHPIPVMHLERETTSHALSVGLRDGKMGAIKGNNFEVVAPRLGKTPNGAKRPALPKAEVAHRAPSAGVDPELARRTKETLSHQIAGNASRSAALQASAETTQQLKHRTSSAVPVAAAHQHAQSAVASAKPRDVVRHETHTSRSEGSSSGSGGHLASGFQTSARRLAPPNGSQGYAEGAQGQSPLRRQGTSQQPMAMRPTAQRQQQQQQQQVQRPQQQQNDSSTQTKKK
jgi:hypothetical protein